MPQRTPVAAQRLAARVAGFTLLLLIASGVFGAFVLQNHIIVPENLARTAQNLLAHERRFRLGILCEIIMFNCDVVLALALYALLRPVNCTLALLGALWRIANATVLGLAAVATLVALDVLGDPHYLATFTTSQLQSLTAIFLDLHDTGSLVALIFWSLGAALHSYLLFRSRYIPRILSAAYLFVAVQLLLCNLALVVFPGISTTLGLGYVLPDLIVELAVALWLSIKGAQIGNRLSAASGPLLT